MTMTGLMAGNGVVDGGGQQRGHQRGQKRGDKTVGGGLAGRGLPVHYAYTVGGEGPYGPAAASAAIHDHHAPRVAGTHPHNGINSSIAQWTQRVQQLDRLDGLDGLMA